MITTLLVANRGEIARRIFRTCKEMGIATVAVYSDPDSGAPHVSEADYGVLLPGASAPETYLRIDLLLDAARAAGADAIHPGYGFLSETSGFAQAVLDAGLAWIGPPPSAIAAMASKVEAKRMMDAAGVPTLSGDRFPVIVKASAGGGGRGMRIVRDAADLPAASEIASAEALNAFGDGTVFIEPYLEHAHHIEVQILADTHGTVWALGERECSVQRRHQKVIEETPSPLIERTPGLRERLFEAAIAAAKAVSYVGAGTVEFLVSGEDFYFLEMNTRLQVEHPVTEAVTGLDLVALQLDIANGGRLETGPPPPQGHAIEARLYAEDSAFTPQSGPLHRFEITGQVRVDSGYESGGVVSVHYDAMLAKVIAHAPTRAAATAKLAGALKRARLHGIATNRELLLGILDSAAFRDGTADTSFLEAHAPSLVPAVDTDLAMLAAALSQPVGWRNVHSQPTVRRFDRGDVSFRLDRSGLDAPAFPHVRLVSTSADTVVLTVDGVRQRFDIATYGDLVYVDFPGGSVSLTRIPRFTDPAVSMEPGTLAAPMPGTVVEILTAVGDTVAAGQPLLRLEAMKMQHTITAPTPGTVTELTVQVGQQVDAGAALITVSEES